MDWTTFTLIIPIARWAKKQLDIAGRERRVLARENEASRREKELSELVELRDYNIKHISDLIYIEPSYLSYVLSPVSNIAEMQFLITNRSIFDLILHKFVVRPKYETQELTDISKVEERTIPRQSGVGFNVKYDLQLPMAEQIKIKRQNKDRAHWQFEMHGYFHSTVGDFEKQQSSSLTTHP